LPLRAIEEKRKFEYHRLSQEEKKKIMKIIAKEIEKFPEVIAAVIFGGFIESELFRDIDIAIFTGYKISYNDVEAFEEKLSNKLEEIVKIPIDVKIIDYAPSWFKVNALSGKKIVEREAAIVARLKFKALQEIEDIKAKYKKIKLKSSSN